MTCRGPRTAATLAWMSGRYLSCTAAHGGHRRAPLGDGRPPPAERKDRAGRRHAAQRTLLHAASLRAEVHTVAERRESDPAQAMGHRDDDRFVASAGAELGEVGASRMVRPRRVVRRFAEHRTQLSGAPFGWGARAESRSPDCWLDGTRPAKLATCSAVQKRVTSATVASTVNATIGPTPGMVCSRLRGRAGRRQPAGDDRRPLPAAPAQGSSGCACAVPR
jgi:hypothetical protein